MYATVIWSIDGNSVNSADIKARVEKAFGTLPSTSLRANVRIARLRKIADLGTLGDRFESIHDDFPTEFDYVCIGSAGGTPLAPESRPTWDAAAVEKIIAEDA